MATQTAQETEQRITDALHRPAHALTAGDMMKRDPVVVPQHMLVREAARLIHQAGASAAAVVGEHGRCVGMLAPADLFRWAAAGGSAAVVDPGLSCPYQVRGRLLNGDEAVVCTLSDGSCPLQVRQPTTGGRYMDVCLRQGRERPPLGTVPRYLTTDGITVRRQAPLLELLRRMLDARAERVVVLDECDRPIGIVSAVDILNAVTDGGGRDSDSGHPTDKEH